MIFNEEQEQEQEEKLDDSWIYEFEKKEYPYNNFYKDNIFTVNMNILYVNKENHIEKVSECIFTLQKPNVISREEIISIIKKNSSTNNIGYSLLSIIKYNITLNPEDIKEFLETQNIDYYNDIFFTTLKNIDAIVFDKTITEFQDLNTLFIVFYEKDKDNVKNNTMTTTRKIYLRQHNTKNKRTLRRS
jgi:hypothetical protein